MVTTIFHKSELRDSFLAENSEFSMLLLKNEKEKKFLKMRRKFLIRLYFHTRSINNMINYLKLKSCIGHLHDSVWAVLSNV